jgi:hypothetical protein
VVSGGLAYRSRLFFHARLPARDCIDRRRRAVTHRDPGISGGHIARRSAHLRQVARRSYAGLGSIAIMEKLSAIDLIVTFIFHASVEEQGGAYATGVLVLILSAAVAVAIMLWREFRADPAHNKSSLPLSAYFWGVTFLFIYTLIDNIFERPDGVIISTVLFSPS